MFESQTAVIKSDRNFPYYLDVIMIVIEEENIDNNRNKILCDK